MRIVLEGCDGVGKTTLAKILEFKYGLEVCHCTQHDASDFDFYLQTLRKDNIVWDRHVIGELIYPLIFNRVPGINLEDAKYIVEFGKQQGTKFFVLTCEDNVIENRLKQRGTEHSLIMNNYKWINETFIFCAGDLDVTVIDTSKMTLQEIFDLIEKE